MNIDLDLTKIDLTKVQKISPRKGTTEPLDPILSPRAQSSLDARTYLFREQHILVDRERDIISPSLQERFKDIRSENELRECFSEGNYTDQLKWLENAKIYFLEKPEYEAYFKAQFGEEPWQQICGFANFLNMLPSEASKVPELRHCINKAFVNEWERINKMSKDQKSLELSKKELCFIPNIVFNFKMLQILMLDNNQLTILPTEIGQLTKLTKLKLDDNQLSKLPTEIKQLSVLIRLLLRKCGHSFI